MKVKAARHFLRVFDSVVAFFLFRLRTAAVTCRSSAVCGGSAAVEGTSGAVVSTPRSPWRCSRRVFFDLLWDLSFSLEGFGGLTGPSSPSCPSSLWKRHNGRRVKHCIIITSHVDNCTEIQQLWKPRSRFTFHTPCALFPQEIFMFRLHPCGVSSDAPPSSDTVQRRAHM